MFRKTVQDITAYMDFLRGEGYTVSLCCIDGAFKLCQGAFAADVLFSGAVCGRLAGGAHADAVCPHSQTCMAEQWPADPCYAGEDGVTIPVSYREKVIACLRVKGFDGSETALYGMTRPLVYMLERLYEQCREHSEYTPATNAYHRGLRFIQEHYTEDISVADVAKNVGYSVSYFGYIFKKNHGVSVNRHLLNLRLAKAAELLRNTDMSVSDIVDKVGFGYATYFSTVFKETYGVSPGAYRKR